MKWLPFVALIGLEMNPSEPLSGATTETRVLRLRSRAPGIRTAVLNINAGQGTQGPWFPARCYFELQNDQAHECFT